MKNEPASPKRNVTITIEEDLLERARVLAFKKRTSLNTLIRQYLQDLVSREPDEYDRATTRLFELMKECPISVGKTTWTRDELHERRRR